MVAEARDRCAAGAVAKMNIPRLFAALALTVATVEAMAIEEAAYKVVLAEDRLEVREYAPQIVAEVIVDGDFENAGNQAFRKLFKYFDRLIQSES